jgi:hypothetical protein
MRRNTIFILAAAALAASCSSSGTSPAPGLQPVAGPPADLADFVGARAGQAELGLQNIGYQLAKTEGLTSFWWNDATKTCARCVTSDGRYQSIDTATPGDCPQ